MEFPDVFSPARIGPIEIKNRFVVPPMGTNYANMDGTVSPKFIEHYAGLARGGFGLIIVEFTAIDPQGRALVGQSALWGDECIEGHRRLVDEVHGQGAKIAVQLAHAGRQTASALTGQPIVAPSPLPCPTIQETPCELTTEEVHQIIQKFIAAAVRAKVAGYDAVEVHGAHGYLLAQFMSGYSNKRVDEFGGRLTGRMKMAVEIVKGIKEKCGPDYPVIFRMSHEEGVPGGRGVLESRLAAKIMAEAGIDALDIAAGNYESLHLMAGSRESAPAYNTAAARELKSAVDLPVIVAGRINDPLIAGDIVQGGMADFVAIGRAALADPEFPQKARDGRLDEIAPCIACSQGCLGLLFTGQPITCLVNPFCGKGETLRAEPAQTPKTVMVVGGGPAGLMAAWVAAKRGHQVTLYEKREILGGQLRIGAIAPSRGEIVKAIGFYIEMCRKYGVRVELSTEVDQQTIEREKPDALIISTGAVPLRPAIKGIDNPDLVTAAEVLEGRKPMGGPNVLVIGGGLLGLETADFMSSYGRRVTVIDLLDQIGEVLDPYSKPFIMRRFQEKGVRTISKAKVIEIAADGVVYENGDGPSELKGFDAIVLAMGYQAYNPLEEKAKGLVMETHVIGDAIQARSALEATAEAAQAACAI